MRTSLTSLRRAATQFTGQTIAGIDRDRETIWKTVEPWLPLAEQRMGEAERSPSHQTHWRAMISAARRPSGTCLPRPDLVALVSAARRLLHALMEAERPGPSAGDIADRVRHAISSGTYPPGSLLAATRIATETGAPTVERVDLALQDLQREGLITISPSKRARVAGSSMPEDRPQQIATWLRFLIQSGVYPPNSALTPVQPLARSLVSSTPDVSRALRLLADQQVLITERGRRTLVHPSPPFSVAAPTSLDDLILELNRHARPRLQLTGKDILAACSQTHTSWSSRTLPDPGKAHDLSGTLVTAGAHLASQAIRNLHEHPRDRDARTTIRRLAATALAEQPSNRWEQTWRAACLGALVREVYDLHAANTGRPDPQRPIHPSVPAHPRFA
ncbi:GntR family transcriptional regulator [Streptomyces sp. NPDC057099]|uniref:GntR family transcriptional regulator n=1 Tax=Streptomyces sp. NPDC057099 TaxID=3346019 RepID=UPI0036369363